MRAVRTFRVVSMLTLLAFEPAGLAADPIDFHYGVIGEQPDNALYAVDNDAEMRSGQTFKLNFQFTTGNWFYVTYLSSTGEYALLYGSSKGAYPDKELSFDTLGWFALDQNKGDETFTLIASEERLEDLEALFENYGKASAASKKRFAKRITNTLADLHKSLEGPEGTELVQRLDAPIMGGVTFRGVTNDEVTQHSLTHKATGERIAEAIFVIKHQ
jgi:hypothetical protein